MPKQVRGVLLGSSGVGKTSLCNAFHLKPCKWFNPKPALDGDYHTKIAMDGSQVRLRVFDAKSDETVASRRQHDCRHCHVFVVCFAIDSRTSFEDARDRWLPEVSRIAPEKKVILVGTKADLRWSCDDSLVDSLVKFCDAEELACQAGADIYLECSASSGKGVSRVFKEIVRTFLRQRNTSVRRSTSGHHLCVIS